MSLTQFKGLTESIVLFANVKSEYSMSDVQNVMTFDKCTINGRMYGDLLDEEGNSIDITEVSFIITISLKQHQVSGVRHNTDQKATAQPFALFIRTGISQCETGGKLMIGIFCIILSYNNMLFIYLFIYLLRKSYKSTQKNNKNIFVVVCLVSFLCHDL